MLVLTLLVLTGLGLVALSGRRPTAATPTAAAPTTAATAPMAATAPTTSWPVGLLLRREPELRGMNDELLASYVTMVGQQRGTLGPEWVTSLAQARAEQLVRVYTARGGRSVEGLNETQKAAMLGWLDHLAAIGMPVDSDEGGLLLNLRESIEYTRSGR